MSLFLNHQQNHITPLHVAAKWGRVNMVNTLLDRGAKIDAKTRVRGALELVLNNNKINDRISCTDVMSSLNHISLDLILAYFTSEIYVFVFELSICTIVLFALGWTDPSSLFCTQWS